MKQKYKLWLDCDGVLADFDRYFMSLSDGVHPRKYEEINGSKNFWKLIQNDNNFFFNLPVMKDAYILYDKLKHLNPTILTGVPNGEWSKSQKLSWRDKHFPGVEMICCPSKDKYKHMESDCMNIIIDDWIKYKHIWEENGGVFILHSSAYDSLGELAAMGVI